MKVQVITSEKLLWSPASPTTALALVALADAFMACTSLILFLIANTSQPVSNSDSSSRFEVGPAWTQRFRQIRWTIHTQFTECKQTDKVKDLHWLTSRKFLEEGGVQVRTQLAYLFPHNLQRSKNWRAPRPTSSELQVPPGDVSHKCANLKAGVYIISIVEFSAIYGMVAVKHTFGLQQNVFYKDHHKHKISLFFYSLITSLGLTDDSVHYFSSSPFKTCFHSKTKTALHFNGCKIPSPSWTSY